MGWRNLMGGIYRRGIPLVGQIVNVKNLQEHHLLPLHASLSTLQISSCQLVAKKGRNNNQREDLLESEK